jgi:hypothetical protein
LRSGCSRPPGRPAPASSIYPEPAVGLEPTWSALRGRCSACRASPAFSEKPVLVSSQLDQGSEPQSPAEGLANRTNRPNAVTREGLEPSRRGGHGLLRTACLPFHHLAKPTEWTVEGIEPSFAGCKPTVFPLDDTPRIEPTKKARSRVTPGRWWLVPVGPVSRSQKARRQRGGHSGRLRPIRTKVREKSRHHALLFCRPFRRQH